MIFFLKMFVLLLFFVQSCHCCNVQLSTSVDWSSLACLNGPLPPVTSEDVTLLASPGQSATVTCRADCYFKKLKIGLNVTVVDASGNLVGTPENTNVVIEPGGVMELMGQKTAVPITVEGKFSDFFNFFSFFLKNRSGQLVWIISTPPDNTLVIINADRDIVIKHDGLFRIRTPQETVLPVPVLLLSQRLTGPGASDSTDAGIRFDSVLVSFVGGAVDISGSTVHLRGGAGILWPGRADGVAEANHKFGAWKLRV